MPCRCTWIPKFALFALLLAVFSLSLPGQSFYGSIVGVVSDASGAAMPGAYLSLVNLGTGDRRTATTGAEGEYRFLNLVPGNYKIDIEQAGFRRYTRDQI